MPKVTVSSDPECVAPSTQFRIPALAVAPAKSIDAHDLVLAFAEARGPNKTSAADSGNNHIVVRRSTSGGETWGPIIHVAWNDWAEGCPHVHPASLCTFLSDPVPLYDAATRAFTVVFTHSSNTVFTTRSTSLGLTWSRPVNITAQAKMPSWRREQFSYFLGPGGGLALRGSNRFVVPGLHSNDNATGHGLFENNTAWGLSMQNHALVSDTAGVSWRISEPVAKLPGCAAHAP